MIQGKTESGFEFSVNENVRNNMELIDELADLDSGNGLALSRICSMTLGQEQKKRLYDHLRLEDGTVPIREVEKELTEILQAVGKNS